MELNLSYQPLEVSEIVYSGTIEQSLECDVILPDYCPDIITILKSSLIPYILSSQVVGDKLTIDGIGAVRVYYSGESACIRMMEYKIPFNKSIQLKSPPEKPIVSIDMETSYFNCRAVNQRRFDMRGAVSMLIKVTGIHEEQAIKNAVGMGIETKEGTLEITNTKAMGDKSFTVREELEVPYGKPSIQNIINTNVTAHISDFKIIAGKIVLKGQVNLHTMYLVDSETNQTETMDHNLPISQIIDVDGIDEDCVCDLSLIVNSADIQQKSDSNGEMRMINVDIGLHCKAIAYKNSNITLSEDFYSTEYDCNLEEKHIDVRKLVKTIADIHHIKENLEIPDANKLMDLWCEASIKEIKYSEGTAIVYGKLMVCMFIFGGENNASGYIEKEILFEHKVTTDCQCNSLELCARASVINSSYSLGTTGKIELKCEICIEGVLYCHTLQKIISDIIPETEKPKTKDNNIGMIIYFADSGEKIWDIAKSHNISTKRVLEENSMEANEVTEKTVLLIPTT